MSNLCVTCTLYLIVVLPQLTKKVRIHNKYKILEGILLLLGVRVVADGVVRQEVEGARIGGDEARILVLEFDEGASGVQLETVGGQGLKEQS